jgi:hypothetical protein
MELQRVRADANGPKANELLDLSHPDMDFVRIAEELAEQLRQAFTEPGPHLIDAIVPPVFWSRRRAWMCDSTHTLLYNRTVGKYFTTGR